jgi:hypothetical protein
MDRHDARQPREPDYKRKRQLWILCLPQNNHRQFGPETVQSHDRDVPEEEYYECAKGQEMQTPGTLPPMKDFDIPWETSGDGWGHRYPRRNAERRQQEYDSRVAQLL